ncbi:hypothetical protein [Pseudomonas purpurea]|uniref:hypothetical protein n=1 Tax=Pseudomonas purpurea TaxID=3136737 RepID=UPI003266A191
MLKTVRFMRRVSFMLWGISLAALLSACGHSLPPPDAGEPKAWVVENVASKSTAQLYADVIAPAVFERSSSKVIDGYTVESGNLRMPDGAMGALVTVRSADGSLIALINTPKKNGVLLINANGERRFESDPKHDDLTSDGILSPDKSDRPGKTSGMNVESPRVVDIFVGYSRAAADWARDPRAHAVAQVESINLSLRNSLVTNVSFKVVGIQVVEQEYLLTEETLERLTSIFAEGIKKSEPDLVFGFFPLKVGNIPGQAGGWAHMPGRIAIGSVANSTIFRHEIGHNAGGDHCNDEGVADYHFGYHNGSSGELMCQKGSAPVYSNPQLKDASGRPWGNAVTADMARVWRENAERLSSYSHVVLGAPKNFRFVAASLKSIHFRWDSTPRAVRYEMWGRDRVSLEPKRFGTSNTTDGFVHNPPSGLNPYHVVAIYFDGTESPESNVVQAKPHETFANEDQ